MFREIIEKNVTRRRWQWEDEKIAHGDIAWNGRLAPLFVALGSLFVLAAVTFSALIW